MQVVEQIADVRRAVATARAAGRSIGFVPTMGYLHDGHLALIAAAGRDNTYTVASIFVNPTQFGPNEDFDRYPRDTAGDLDKCRTAGVDLVFMPSTDTMYPSGSVTRIHVGRLAETLCGAHRPGHFDGVATVVAKLFNIVAPDRAYFGEKDAQQLAIIRRMVRDLDMPLEIVGCPTVREPSGLARSSRNAMLTADEHERATALHRALCIARDRLQAGERDVATLLDEMQSIVAAAKPTGVDYISIVDASTLQPVTRVERAVLVALAVRFGGTRLIDNVTVDPFANDA